MKDSNMRARISQLHKTESQWALIPNFVPFQGELIIFDPDKQYKYARVKIGDGISKLSDLPFFIEPVVETFIDNNTNKIIDAGRVTDYKK